MKDFLDVSGSIIIRNGFIYNDHLSNYLTHHDNYLFSLSGLFLSQNNSINSYIATNNINYNILKPYLLDSSYYNYVTISGVTISSFIYQPSLINYHSNQINTISSYIYNFRFPNYDDQFLTLSNHIVNYTNSVVSNKVTTLINSSPQTVYTLNELANALGNDANFSTATSVTVIPTK
jgi:hypothetical protein